MTEIEEFLAKEYNKRYCVFTGSGTSALFLAFKVLDLKDKEVLFPAISCVNPVNAAICAGYGFDFCDVDPKRFTLDLDVAESLLASGKYGIIVPTHIYGHREDMPAVRRMCDKYGVHIVEDCAQAAGVYGAALAAVSFGHTKIFECENGGGAVFCDDESTYLRLKELKKNLPPRREDYRERVNEYRKNYYSIMNGTGSRQEKLLAIGKLQEKVKDNDIFDIPDNNEVIDVIGLKDTIVTDRIRKKKLYDELLTDEAVIKPEIYSDEAVWRYSFLYTGDRNRLLRSAREQHIDISTWYPSLSMIYKGYDHENAKKAEEHIVNLWVDASHTDERIKEDIKILNVIMEEDNGME